jgi:acetoin utilization deacetylase AcuC-like enzyme
MWDNDRKEFTLRDHSQSYLWMVEDMENVAALSLDEIEALVDVHASFVLEEAENLIEKWAANKKYPVYGYTTTQRIEDREEYIEFWMEQMYQDIKADMADAVQAIQEYVAEQSNA